MAKFYGSIVKRGKVGASVFAVRNGVTIERQYQPMVYNPNTPNQVAARAKLKTLSQLSEVMASVIAIPRRGLVSPRNTFTKLNYGVVSFADGQATVNLTSVKLTEGILSLPTLTIGRGTSGISAQLSTAASEYDRVVYAMFRRNADNTLLYVASSVVEKGTDTAPVFATTLTTSYTTQAFVVYAYGIRDNTEAARVVFGNVAVPSAEMIATLIVQRTLLDTDVTLSETVAAISAPNTTMDAPSDQRMSKKNSAK